MLTFTDFRQQTEAAADSDEMLTESRSLIRKGAAAAFTLKSRAHAKNAQASFQSSLTALKSAKTKTTAEKIDSIGAALESALEGLIEITKQLSQSTAVSASSALLNERSDREILRLLAQRKGSKKSRRR